MISLELLLNLPLLPGKLIAGKSSRGLYKPDPRELPEGSPWHQSWQSVLSEDQGSQTHLGTISCPSQILIDDSVDRAEQFLPFPKATLGEVVLLENVAIPSHFKFVVGFCENSACGYWI